MIPPVPPRITGTANVLIAGTNTRITPATTPGRLSGKMTRRKTWNRPAPRISPASSSDGSIFSSVAYSPDGRIVYHTDSNAREIYRFDVRPEGSLAGKRVFARFEESEGFPDGMTTDRDGCLWVA